MITVVFLIFLVVPIVLLAFGTLFNRVAAGELERYLVFYDDTIQANRTLTVSLEEDEFASAA